MNRYSKYNSSYNSYTTVVKGRPVTYHVIENN